MLHATIIYATINVVMNVEDPCRKGLSFMKRQNTITLEVTDKELELLKNSVQFSCDNKKMRLLEACEGGYDNSDGMVHIDPARYEEFWQYEDLMNTLKNAGPLPF